MSTSYKGEEKGRGVQAELYPYIRTPTSDATLAGTRALVDAGYPAKLVDKAVNEAEELQPLALRVRNG